MGNEEKQINSIEQIERRMHGEFEAQLRQAYECGLEAGRDESVGIELAPFWIVWCSTSLKPPRVRHYSEETAVGESKRLARSNPGQSFFVCKVIGQSFVSDAAIYREVADVEIPF